MNKFAILLKSAVVAAAVSLAGGLTGCNKDDVIENVQAKKPVITFDSETGVYTVKAGSELTVSPIIENADNATFRWTLDGGKIIGRSATLVYTWDTPGDYYVTLTVITSAGSVEEDIKIEVVDFTPPVISLNIPPEGLKVVAGADYLIEPSIQHDTMDGFEIEWFVDGVAVSRDRSYVFNRETIGVYKVKIVATNVDGTSEKEFEIEVVASKPYEVSFLSPSYFQTSTDRYTFVGRPVYLRPVVRLFDDPSFEWSVDGKSSDCTDRIFAFTPSSPGTYTVKLIVREADGSGSASAEVKVICVDKTENDILRAKTAASDSYSTEVFEWTPAPGQFIGETSALGGMTGNETTLELANAWARQQLDKHQVVSLGAFGGYIVVGFDHSIVAGDGGEYDFSVTGNAFKNSNGGSNEPGIVWVMQDVNGNGIPDDEWYELRGCESGNATTTQFYAVTYFRPSAPQQNVDWTDSNGKNGCVDYVGSFHKQDYYYPAWVTAESYTLYGTCLDSKNNLDPSTGYWANNAYDWGYADNVGSDSLTGKDDGEGQRTCFKISNAVYPDGSAVNLKFIDFIKVQTGVNAKSGWLGEISTEVAGFRDLSF